MVLHKLVYLLWPPQNYTILPFSTRNPKKCFMIFSLTCYKVPHGIMHTVSDMYLSLLFYTLLTLEQSLLGGSVFHMFSPNSLSLKRYRQIWGLKARPPTSVSLISSLFFVACFSSDLFSPSLVPFMCCFSLFSLCSRCSGVSSLLFPARSFLRCRERLLPAAKSEHHNLSFAATCFDHRDHSRPVFAAASSWVDPICLQPTLPHPRFIFCISSCWRFV
jgi:hypothetical protein